jgi:hypothetical protein
LLISTICQVTLPDEAKFHGVATNSFCNLLVYAEFACEYFANISFESSYDDENVLEYFNPPQNVCTGQSNTLTFGLCQRPNTVVFAVAILKPR